MESNMSVQLMLWSVIIEGNPVISLLTARDEDWRQDEFVYGLDFTYCNKNVCWLSMKYIEAYDGEMSVYYDQNKSPHSFRGLEVAKL
jgi:hypothetical protein